MKAKNFTKFQHKHLLDLSVDFDEIYAFCRGQPRDDLAVVYGIQMGVVCRVEDGHNKTTLMWFSRFVHLVKNKMKSVFLFDIPPSPSLGVGTPLIVKKVNFNSISIKVSCSKVLQPYTFK